jgi:hypothetical protein
MLTSSHHVLLTSYYVPARQKRYGSKQLIKWRRLNLEEEKLHRKYRFGLPAMI